MDTNQTKATPQLLSFLQDYEGVIEETLPSADIAFSGRGEDGKLSLSLGVEIKKSPDDIMASLRDGRLMDQLPRMLEDYDLALVVTVGSELEINLDTGRILEIDLEKRKKTGRVVWVDSPYSFHFINSTLMKFEAAGGLVRHVQDYEHCAALLLSMHNYWGKLEHNETSFSRKRHKYVAWKKLDNPLAEVYERMHVGIKRALLLAEKYPSIEELCDASEGQLASIPGFGRKTARRVRAFVEEGRYIK
tara:strand:+ start:3176 stop:3916 length:741 start_codon:yes stop_codon:yes gene_type:complete